MREPEDTSTDVQPVSGGIPGQVPRVAARLCNFKTNGSELWKEHKDWLRDNVIPILRDPQGAWVDLLAYASARGDSGKNNKLSEARRKAVEDFLKSESGNPNLPVNRNHAFGEELSGPDQKNNSGYFRSVDVYVYGGRMPPVVPPVQVGSRRFKMRCLGSASPGVTVPKTPVGIGGDIVFFEIIDLHLGQRATFVYGGGGFSIGMPGIPFFVPIATEGTFTEFTLSRESSLFDFEGPADLLTDAGASVPGASVGGDICLKFKARNFVTRGVFVFSTKRKKGIHGYVVMDTGAGVSLTLGGVTQGKIVMRPHATVPFP